MSPRLLEEQGDADYLIDFTHFDAWFEESEEFFWQADDARVAEIMQDVLIQWDEKLSTHIVYHLTTMHDNILEFINAVGWDNTWDIIVMQILQGGYDVFYSDNMVEIYTTP